MEMPTEIGFEIDEATMRRRYEGIARLAEATCSLAAEVDQPRVHQQIVAATVKTLECERVYLHLYDREHHDLHTNLAGGNEFRQSLTAGICGDVATSRLLANVAEPAADTRWDDTLDRSTGFATRNLLAIPLAAPSDDSLLGVLELLNKNEGEFDAIDESLLIALAHHAEVALDRARIVQEIRDQHELNASLQAAREIQRRFMPSRMPEIAGYEVATWWLPNQAVGGDYCDVIPLGTDKLGLCVADVSGHGLGPSLLMASVRAALHALVLEHSCPQVLMEMIGRCLAGDLHCTNFITMVLASLDLRTHRLVFSNAGHAPALHYSSRKNAFDPLEATGMPLGVDGAPQYPLGPTLEIKCGDWVVLCTDGIVEAMDAGEVQFGYQRLEQIVANHAHVSAREMVCIIGSEVEKYYTEEHPQDDLTVLALHRVE